MTVPASVAEQTTTTRRLNVGEYLRLFADAEGKNDVRTELLDGLVVEQMTKHAPHNYTARQVGILLAQILPATWLISEEKSLRLGRFWRPEPDVALIRGPNSRYRRSDPKAADVALLVEVADSTYATDRGLKWQAYAAARIPAYWIVNLNAPQVEVYSDPIGRGQKARYREAAVYMPSDEVPVLIDGVEVGRICVKDILP